MRERREEEKQTEPREDLQLLYSLVLIKVVMATVFAESASGRG